MIKIEELKFGADGLIPAVVTDYFTKEVLTLAYMNEESLRISMEEGYTCFLFAQPQNAVAERGNFRQYAADRFHQSGLR